MTEKSQIRVVLYILFCIIQMYIAHGLHLFTGSDIVYLILHNTTVYSARALFSYWIRYDQSDLFSEF